MKIRASSDRGRRKGGLRGAAEALSCPDRPTNASEALGVHSREKDGSVALCSAIYI